MCQRLLPAKMAGYRSYRRNPFNTFLLHEQQFEAALIPHILLIAYSALVVRSVRTMLSKWERQNTKPQIMAMIINVLFVASGNLF